MTQRRLSQQHLRQKTIHDKQGTAEQLQIGDVVWLYTPVVKQANTKKFSAFWKGPYTVIDKASPVNYKVQLLGGTQTLIVHRNRIKLCYNPCDHLPASPGTHVSPPATSTGITGYTSSMTDQIVSPQPSGRPVRSCRPLLDLLIILNFKFTRT